MNFRKQKNEIIKKVKNTFADFFRFLFTKKIDDLNNIPIIINNYNRLSCLKDLIQNLTNRGYHNIFIIDNNSKYEPLLDYYKQIPHKVFYLDKNLGSKAFWKSGIWYKFMRSYFVLTDPDVIPIKECPANFIEYFYRVLEKHPRCHKTGFSLKLDDIPDSFDLKSKVIEWESKFYKEEVSKGLFKAPIDTTFALYRPFSKSGRRDGSTVMYRTAYPYQARHTTWYMNSNKPSEEAIFYKDSITNRTHWTRQLDHKKNKKSIVFFNKYIPEFDKGSGANRFNEIVKELINQNYNVILISKRGKNNTSYIAHYQKLGLQVFCCEKNKTNYKKYLKKNIKEIDLFWFYGPNSFKTYFSSFLSENHNSAKLIYDMIDIHHLRYKRALKINSSNKVLKKQVNKYFKLEINSAINADYVLTISEKEKIYMSDFVDLKKIKVLSNIHVPKIKLSHLNEFSIRKDLIFIGSGHTPNIDALDFLYNEIMPIVWKKMPEVKVNVVGKVIDLVSFIKDPRFVLHGFVEDVSSLFNSSKMMVVPLRYGAGVKGKLGHAFEYALPVVSTRIGSEGMFLKNNENILKADTALDFANNIIKLYEDECLWNKLSKKSFSNLDPFGKTQVSLFLNSIDY